MSTLTSPVTAVTEALADGVVVAKRNLIKIVRIPELLVWTLMSPIMFVLLFSYVFGGSIEIPGMDYREFLLPGIFAQTVVFGATFTGAGLAEDMQKGVIDRFRSLPMSRTGVLLGRTVSDVVYNFLSISVMAITGLVIGWRVRTSLLEAIGGILLLLLFAYGISWVMAYVGLLVPSPEVVNNASFIVIMPLTFVAHTFVDASRLPGPLETFALWNPVSAVAQASRELFGNVAPGTVTPDAWSMQHPVAYTLLWVALLLVVFIPLSTRQYQRAAQR
jgi:ABC transporter DrrB family efflux protein